MKFAIAVKSAVAALLAFAASGCGKTGPAQVAEKFAKAVCAGDFETAQSISSDALAAALNAVPAQKRPAAKVKCDTEHPLPHGTGMSVRMRVTSTTGWNAPVQIMLTEVDGGWIVANDIESVRILLAAPKTDERAAPEDEDDE